MTSALPLPRAANWFRGCCVVLLCWPCLITACVLDLPKKISKTMVWRARRRRKYAARPLPRSRPRALSIPRPEKKRFSLMKPKATLSQLQSAFCRLPSELRLMIYRELFDHDVVHIVPMHHRLGSFWCIPQYQPQGGHQFMDDYSWSRQPPIRQDGSYKGIPALCTYANTGIGVLPLLLTCRTMYALSKIARDSLKI